MLNNSFFVSWAGGATWERILDGYHVWACQGATGQACSISPLGKRYITITHAGVKPEGAGYAFAAATQEEAMSLLFKEVQEFLAENGCTRRVCVRALPYVKEIEGGFAATTRMAAA